LITRDISYSFRNKFVKRSIALAVMLLATGFLTSCTNVDTEIRNSIEYNFIKEAWDTLPTSEKLKLCQSTPGDSRGMRWNLQLMIYLADGTPHSSMETPAMDQAFALLYKEDC